MSVKLNDRAFDHAKRLITEGQYVLDDRDAWSEHQPTAAEENRFIEKHGWSEYALWHLGVDTEKDEDTRAGRSKYEDVESACAHLHGMLEALR